jgi:4-hydroxythreonine-4-phosphate dehydrogenase
VPRRAKKPSARGEPLRQGSGQASTGSGNSRTDRAPPRQLPRLAISLGDPSGIGAEVTAKALWALRGKISPVVFGDLGVLERELGRLGLPLVGPGEAIPEGGARVAVTRLPLAAIRPGKPAPKGGLAQLAFLEAAFECVARGEADALVTAPVSKAQVARALPGFVGHTEWLEARCASSSSPGTRGTASGAKRSVMMLAGEQLRIALVTNHVAFRELTKLLTPALVAETIAVTFRALREDLGIAAPRLALAALNPHAGEEGAFGDEETTLLAPALALAARRGAKASGPYPADSVFFRAALGEFDAVVSLYHDQGLIPVKLLDAVAGDPAVNVTLGLPIVRTSPDHGVAYGIAGKGVANPSSMIAAVKLAARIVATRAGRAARRGASR